MIAAPQNKESPDGRTLEVLARLLRAGDRRLPEPVRLLFFSILPLGAVERFMNRKHHNPLLTDIFFRDWGTEVRAKQLGRALWAGFGTTAAKKLQAIQVSRRSNVRDGPPWSLAQWHHSRGEFEEALNQLTLRRAFAPKFDYDPVYVMIEVDTLLGLHRVMEAAVLVEGAIATRGELPVLCMCASNVFAFKPGVSRPEADRIRLEWLSKPLLAAGLAALELKDPSRALNLGNVMAQPRLLTACNAKISILMPTHNAEATIATAIDSILSQSWTNLELVIVDDGSCDGTWSIVERYVRKDSRVRAYKNPHNRGAYVVRNAALRKATGEYVTVSDADDWSHPERLAVQVEHLQQTGLSCNTISSIRADPDLRVLAMPRAAVIREAFPSLMMRREHVLELGGWDEARMGADAEFYARLLAHHGHSKTRVLSDVPLMVQLSRPESLTGLSYTGLSTTRYGARREYTEAYQYWHGVELAREAPCLRIPMDRRPFPVPGICKPGKSETLQYDILWVSDFAGGDDASLSISAMLRSAKQLGLRSACLHWPTLDSADRPIDRRFRQLLHDEVMDSVVAGESVTCKLVLVSDAKALLHMPDILPTVRADNAVVIVDQVPAVTEPDGSRLYMIKCVLEHCKAAFGLHATLAPLWSKTRHVLQSVLSDRQMTEADWAPFISERHYGAREMSWDGTRHPIVSCQPHFESPVWELNDDGLASANPDTVAASTRVLAHLRRERSLVIALLMAPLKSLSSADFFIYYPADEVVSERFPHAVLKAMALGIPVVLPRRFESVFLGAAIYAEPAGVVSAIKALWTDQTAYEAQVRAGQDYLDENCGLERFEEFISTLLGRRFGPPERHKEDAPKTQDADIVNSNSD